MKSLYKVFAVLLAVCCQGVCLAAGNDTSTSIAANPSIASISLSNTEGINQVCINNAFTATLNVANETSGLSYRWTLSIGSVNGQTSIVTTTSKTATLIVQRLTPGSSNTARIAVTIMRNGSSIAPGYVWDVTVLPQVIPAQPSGFSITPTPPYLTEGQPCQYNQVTIKLDPVSGAYGYIWTANGTTTNTTSRSYTTSFSNTGNQVVTVRAVGCAGTSAAKTISFYVVSSSQPPCNGSTFAVTEDVKTIKTSPNPATTIFTLETPTNYVGAEAQLMDLKSGTVVKKLTVTGTSMQVDTKGLASGIYSLTVESKEGKLTNRIVVQ